MNYRIYSDKLESKCVNLCTVVFNDENSFIIYYSFNDNALSGSDFEKRSVSLLNCRIIIRCKMSDWNNCVKFRNESYQNSTYTCVQDLTIAVLDRSSFIFKCGRSSHTWALLICLHFISVLNIILWLLKILHIIC